MARPVSFKVRVIVTETIGVALEGLVRGSQRPTPSRKPRSLLLGIFQDRGVDPSIHELRSIGEEIVIGKRRSRIRICGNQAGSARKRGKRLSGHVIQLFREGMYE